MKKSLIGFLTLTLLSSTVIFVNPAYADLGFTGWRTGDSGWSGKGVAFLPGGNYVGGSSGSSSDCCAWKIIYVCEAGPDGTGCVAQGCAAGENFAWLVNLSHEFDVYPQKCIDPGEPRSEQEISYYTSSKIKETAPKAQPGFQPNTTALTQIPTIFWSGQSGRIQRSDNFAGVPVDFEATASWTWNWGDGTNELHTRRAGGQWPDIDVKHTYRRAGKFRVTLTTTWDASFSVSGVGPFPVSGEPVAQAVSFTVTVKEARAVLINNPVI